MRLALFQPDIPQNVGAAIRLAACLAVPLDVIEPCGFPLGDRALRRAALDYGPLATIERHDGWEAFLAHPARQEGVLALFTTHSAQSYDSYGFAAGDTLIFGRESAGAPPQVHAAAQVRLRIPLAPGARSLNLVVAAGMALGEALRQTRGFPSPSPAASGRA
jgi:tRNA (cytidine/uridine-2'-O-)-methyltransferase